MRITDHIAALTEYGALRENIRAGQTPCAVFGVPESLKPHLAAALADTEGRPVIIVTATDDKAAAYADAVPNTVYLPPRPLQLRASVARSRDVMFARISALSKLLFSGAKVVFLSEEALSARLVPKQDFIGAYITINKDAVYDPQALLEKLVLAGYERVSAVETPGQAARRGEILDIYCPGCAAPYRIDFFDDTVESIHEFDPISQRRGKRCVDSVRLSPAIELTLSGEAAVEGAARLRSADTASETMKHRLCDYADSLEKSRFFEDMESYAYAFCDTSLADYLPSAVTVFDDYKHIAAAAESRREIFLEKLKTMIEKGEAAGGQHALYIAFDELTQRAADGAVLDLCAISTSRSLRVRSEVSISAKNALSYNRRMDMLKDDVAARVHGGWRVGLFCGSAARARKLAAELSDAALSVPFVEQGHDISPGTAAAYGEKLLSGFELSTAKTYFLGEHEIYGFVRKRKKAPAKKSLDIFTDLKTGDIIVHDVHGKGRFLGLITRAVQGISRDYLELEYRGGDKLFIPTDQIDRVQKYMGGDATRLSKLGGREWGQTKARVKNAVKELAEDLVAIYSERLGKKGFRYGEDTVWQKQFEDMFPYEETDGQLRSIAEIKADMEQEKIMDRLLLGDVGYGKTEVAMRACFKSVMEGRQCAVLVPTTLLARQHFHTFEQRFAPFAVKIAMLSRFVSARQQQETIRGIAAGTVDIVIGTHRLLSKDVVFKDLGLLIVDEEQRFGVTHKERIKDLKRSVDVLTLSATPIPRTLQMSLSGIRDMSMIDTPPEERRMPESYVMAYSGDLLRDAVTKEMARGGQTYFVCRQIRTMDRLAADLREYVPNARVAAAHGQMGEAAIEQVMVGFLAGDYDVLLCTTIIESGIDIPNVNTVIVYEADKFGLAQLYQIKGRVGRAAKSAYAYLTYISNMRMTPDAEKRLQTIAEFTEFGAGFKIAMRDLEIRGAGNLLGPEQSGQMAAVGYDMYCRMMREAVADVRGKPVPLPIDTAVEIRIDAHVPPSYISDEMQRIEVYKKIAAVDGTKSARQMKEELSDRFGKVPKPVENLILISLIKSAAAKAGIVSVTRSGRIFSLKYGETIAPNAQKLIAVLARYPGTAQLKATEPPYIMLKPQGRAVDALLTFLRDIRRCIIRQHQV